MRINNSSKLITFIFCFGLLTPVNADSNVDPHILESRKVIKEFGGKLKKQLVQAMEEGGPVNAIKVCNIEAPGIAANLSEKFQMQVGRTSLKTRNPNNNPDEWERMVLEEFEQRLQHGGDPKTFEHSEETDHGFRYMKAIPTKGLCLTCHGEKLHEDLKNTITELYPEDKATGFKAGQIRGAFSILISKE